MTDNNILYDEKGAATYVGGQDSPISTRTLQRWRLEGDGPVYVKLGRLVRYRKSDLDALPAARVCTSTSETSAWELHKAEATQCPALDDHA